MLVFCDLETTGLDRAGHILEAAFVATDAHANPFSETSLVINPGTGNVADGADPDWRRMFDPFAEQMHRNNGLLEEVEHGVSYHVAAQRINGWLNDIGMPDNTVPLCGSTIDFNRDFLRRRTPEIERRFHYRSINVSSVKELAVRWAPLSARWPSVPADQKAHRALPDIHESIRELQHYKREIFDRIPQTHTVVI